MTNAERRDAAAYRLMFGRLGKWPERPIRYAHIQDPMPAAERTDRLAAVAALRAEAER